MRRRIILDPLRDLCDGRSLFRPRGRDVGERIVPPRCEGGTIGPVALTRSEQVRASKARNFAKTEFRAHETPADEAGTINRRCGSGGRGRKGEWGRRGLPVKERIGEVREGVRCAECTRFHGVHSRTPVVVRGGSEVKPSEPMMEPRGSTIRPLMHHN